MTSEASLTLLGAALTQAGDLLDRVGDDRLDATTPCSEWVVDDLVDHLVAAPTSFAAMLRGEEVDWSAGPPHVGADRADLFREHGDALLEAWRSLEGGEEGQAPPLDWQLAELAVHTWDLATALGEPTDGLDPDVAEAGLAFMRGGLTDDNRGPAFGPERPAPEDADAYTRLAGFAGRAV